ESNMAESMQDIKRRIRSITSTEHITNAMKLVASAKFRKSKLAFDKTNEYLGYVTSAINDACVNAKEVSSVFIGENDQAEKICYIVITSNKGLCGAFNSNVIKRTEALIKENGGKSNLVTIGLKGRDYFLKRGYDISGECLISAEALTFVEARELSQPILKMYEEGEIDKVVLVYTKFVNTMHQEVDTKVLLPMKMEDIVKEEAPKLESPLEFAPSAERVLDYLIPKYMELELYKSMVESSVCEFIGRRVAMENATDNAQDMLGKLSLNYNRARQSAITNELIEIVAGAEALK
ncbi:MAG: ATP synthase F1 subunit gamma, partial [Clostridia bacterium]|nr:ATP synthase F1 subunit gamma [Clostridia bacterium]